MEVSLILAHPGTGSFNHAIARAAEQILRANGHRVALHDLCAEGFDPVLPAAEISKDADLPEMIARHCREIARAEGIIVVHPNWWGQPPAILKGWIDRILRQGVAYAFGQDPAGQPAVIGLLKARCALVFNTANTPYEQELKLYGDPLENLWKTCVFGFCGVRTVIRRLYTPVILSTQEQRRVWLEDVQRVVAECFPPQSSGRNDSLERRDCCC